jgi:hypothetical protein
MSRMQLKAIFAVLGTLLLVYAGIRLLGGTDGRVGAGRDLGALIGPEVDLIRVSGPETGADVELSRDGNEWTVNGYPADTALVREALAGLDTARVGRLAARSAANHARLGVANDSSRLVEIGPASDPALGFHLGNRGRDGRFVRFAGEDEVYVVPEASVGMLDREADEWRDRQIAALDTSRVIGITVERRDEAERAVLERTVSEDGASTWIENGVAADSGAVENVLSAVADLRADGFPSDSVAFAADFESPVARLELQDSEEVGAPPGLSLLFLTAPDAHDFLVRRSDDPLVYRLSVAQIERLLPSRDRLFPTP